MHTYAHIRTHTAVAFVCAGKIFPALYLASALMGMDILLGVLIHLCSLS